MSLGTIHAIQVFTNELKTVKLSELYCIDCCFNQYRSGILVSNMTLSQTWAYDSACVDYDPESGFTATKGTILFWLKYGHLTRKDKSDMRVLTEGGFGQQYLLDRNRCCECSIKLNGDCADYGNKLFNKIFVDTVYYVNSANQLVKKQKSIFHNQSGYYTRLSGCLAKLTMQWIQFDTMERAYYTLPALRIVKRSTVNELTAILVEK